MQERLLTSVDVQRILSVDRDTARRYMHRMPHVVLGGKLRVDQATFQTWLSQQTVREEERPKKKPLPYYDPNLFEPDGRLKRRKE